MPKRDGGGLTWSANVDINLCTESYFDGSQSMRITTPSIIKPLTNATGLSLPLTSIHRNYETVDNFESYTREYVTEFFTGSDDAWPGGLKGWVPDYVWEEGYQADADIGEGFFGMNAPHPNHLWDWSSYSILSFQVLAGYPVNFDITLFADGTASGETVSTPVIPGIWTRMEVPIGGTNIDKTKITYIKFIPRGTPGAYVYMDDIRVIDARTETDKTDWISMDINSLNYNRDNNVNYTQVAGRFGDSIYSTNPNRRRGTIGFRTKTPSADDDLLFIESAIKKAEKLYFRCLTEGYLIQPLDSTVDIKDGMYGPQKIITFKYIEGTE